MAVSALGVRSDELAYQRLNQGPKNVARADPVAAVAATKETLADVDSSSMYDLEQICSTVEFSGPQPTEPPTSELALVFSSSDAAAFAGVHDHNLAGFGKL